MASGDAVQQIKDRLSIVDVVSQYVELHKAGKNLKGKSPFTSERTPSFFVSPDRGMYYCFSSSQGGDMFTFVQAMEGVDFRGALQILAEKAGVELVPEDPKKKSEREKLYDLLEDATKFFEESLDKKKEAEEYVKKRGVSAQSRAKWRLGYAPGPPEHGWRELKSHLEDKSYTQKELVSGGLIKGLDTGKEPYDVFRDRVMFPLFDVSGRVVAYSGRTLSTDPETPKYVNSPETELYNKSELLYGFDKAKQGIRNYDFSLIVEGQFDVVLSHQAGYTNAVAVSGTALTPFHVSLLQRLSDKVVLALDSDRAGIAAVKRAADLMLSRGMDVKVANLPSGEDPADIINKDLSLFKQYIGKSTHVIEFLLKVIKEEAKDERSLKLKARQEILPYILRIPNHIDQDHFETLVANELNTSKDAIHLEVQKLAEEAVLSSEGESKEYPTQANDSPNTEEVNSARKEELEKYLLALSTILTETNRDTITAAYKEITGTDTDSRLRNIKSTDLSKLTFTVEAHVENLSEKQLKDDLNDKLEEFSTLIMKENLRDLRIQLRAAEDGGDDKEAEKLLKKMSKLGDTEKIWLKI